MPVKSIPQFDRHFDDGARPWRAARGSFPGVHSPEIALVPDTLSGMTETYLVVLGEREAISWVLREERMAFPSTPRAEVAALAEGDELMLYATRGAWHNPSRDRGRIIGHALVTSAVRPLAEPLHLAGRDFHSQCRLRITGLVPYPGGVEVAPLVPRLTAFPKPDAWSIYLRRALLRLPPADITLLAAELRAQLQPRRQALPSYPVPASASLG
jgi:hypothetical protein